MADASMYVINPVFQAKSFEEMVKPLSMYAQAYKEQEAKIEDMTDKAAALEWIANQDPDSQTAALYKDMSGKIKGIRDDIMMNGLTGGLRSRILGTRRIYSANSSEITRRYQDMIKYRERMEQLQDKDPSMRFSIDSLNIGIDDFAGGKRPKIKAISGDLIAARGAAVGKRLSSQVFNDGISGQVAEGQFWRMYKEAGMTDKALMKALDSVGKSDKYNMVKRIIDNVYGSFSDFGDADQRELKNRFIEGVYTGATYAKDVSYQANADHMTPLQKTQLQIALDENRWRGEEHDATMRLYGYNPIKNSKGLIVGYEIGSNGITNPKSSSRSSSGNTGGQDGRQGVMYAKYMKAGDNSPYTFEPGSGEDSQEKIKEAMKGKRITVTKDGDVISMHTSANGLDTPFATYNIQTDTVASDAITSKKELELLRNFGWEVSRAIADNPGGVSAVNSRYDLRWHDDEAWFGNDASFYIGPAVKENMPILTDSPLYNGIMVPAATDLEEED